jgi:hypothetical protein
VQGRQRRQLGVSCDKYAIICQVFSARYFSFIPVD